MRPARQHIRGNSGGFSGSRGSVGFRWFHGTKMFKAMVGTDGDSTGVDETFARRCTNGFGALILSQNMFGPGLGA